MRSATGVRIWAQKAREGAPDRTIALTAGRSWCSAKSRSDRILPAQQRMILTGRSTYGGNDRNRQHLHNPPRGICHARWACGRSLTTGGVGVRGNLANRLKRCHPCYGVVEGVANASSMRWLTPFTHSAGWRGERYGSAVVFWHRRQREVITLYGKSRKEERLPNAAATCAADGTQMSLCCQCCRNVACGRRATALENLGLDSADLGSGALEWMTKA